MSFLLQGVFGSVFATLTSDSTVSLVGWPRGVLKKDAAAGPLTNAIGARWVWGLGAISYAAAFVAAAALAPTTRQPAPDERETAELVLEEPVVVVHGGPLQGQ